MANTNESQWSYPLVGVLQDKRGGRTLTEKGRAHELIGIDGNEEGALRPFPGFYKVHTLCPSGGMAALEGSAHTAVGSKLVDCYPFHCRVGTSSYAYGFVYRVQRPSSALADVFVDFWCPLSSGCTSTAWPDSTRGKKVATGVTTSTLMNHSLWPWRPGDNPQKSMSVSVWGQFVYVFVEGSAPRRFHIDASGALVVLGAAGSPFPGPGKRPQYISHEFRGIPGSLQSLTDGSVTYPGRAQLILTDYSPEQIGLYPCSGFTGSGPSGGGLGTGTGYVPTSGTTAFVCCGGGDVPPQVTSQVRTYTPGDYTFAYQLYDSVTGLKSALSDVAQVTTDDFGTPTPAPRYMALEIVWEKAKYDHAYVYRSVRVQSALGTYGASVLHLEKIIRLDDYKTCQSPYSSGTVGQALFYFGMEDKPLTLQSTFEDASLFDEEVPSAGASFLYENTLFLGKITKGVSGMLTSSSSLENRENDGVKTSAEIRFSSLVGGPPELFPPKNRYVMPVPGNDIQVYREAAGSLIGFSNDKQYFVKKDSNYVRVEPLHEGNGVVGPRAADTVGSSIYFLSNKGLRAIDSQGQLDEVRALNHLFKKQWAAYELPHVSMAYDPRLATLFIHNPCRHHTACLWFSTSRTSELVDTSFTQVVRGFFPVEVLDNSYSGLLIDYSKQPEERALFISDTPYEGNPGATNTVGDSDLASWRPRIYVVNDRRLLTQRFFGTNSVTTAYSPSTKMLPIHTNGTPTDVTSTITREGAAYWTLATGPAGSQTITVSVDAGNTSAAAALPEELENCWMYVLTGDSEHSYLIGAKALVKRKLSGSTFKVHAGATLRDPIASYPMSYFQGTTGFQYVLYAGAAQMPEDGGVSAPALGPSSIAAGTRIVLSPIYMRWVGTPLALQTEEGIAFDAGDNFFRKRRVNTVGVAFSRIDGPSIEKPVGNEDLIYRAFLYRGEEVDPAVFGISRARTGVATGNVDEGVPTHWPAFGDRRWPPTSADQQGRTGYSANIVTPGFEIISADVDFQIVGVQVRGVSEADARPHLNT